jgi:hypothetical protein
MIKKPKSSTKATPAKVAKTPVQFTPPPAVPVGAIPDGKIVDFLTGHFVNDTPEEYVRQNIEKALVRQYKYDPAHCRPEVRIKMGSAKPRVDIVVFPPDEKREQSHAYILVETKKPGTSPQGKKDGIGQLQSYMAACPNALYGLWTNGDDRFCFAKRVKAGKIIFDEIVDIPSVGQSEADAARPKRTDLMPATADNLLFAFRRCHNYIAGTEGRQQTTYGGLRAAWRCNCGWPRDCPQPTFRAADSRPRRKVPRSLELRQRSVPAARIIQDALLLFMVAGRCTERDGGTPCARQRGSCQTVHGA